MSKFYYLSANFFVFLFMFILWMTTYPFYTTSGYNILFIPLFALATIYFGEILWGEIVYKPANPLRRFHD